MGLKTIYVIDYKVLRGTKDILHCDFYKNIPMCFEEHNYTNIEVESIPKEKEILLFKRNGELVAMNVFKVVHYEWKVFVIVNNTESDLRSMEKEFEGDEHKKVILKVC